jgi:hypothetical protein
MEEAHCRFVREQRDIKISLGQLSPYFGVNLLPGMFSMPIGIVPKPHSTNLHMVIDQSADPFSQNSLITKTDGSVQMGTMHDLDRVLHQVWSRHPSTSLVIFKSDVSWAYWLMPMHPLWQINQIMTIDGQCHVNQCNHFGNHAAWHISACFMALVLWIAITVKNIEDLLGYVNDNFSWDFERNLLFYQPYNKLLPAKQTHLLQLWDELGIPHEERKQEWGQILTVIGFEVDPNTMIITMPKSACNDLVLAIWEFLSQA